MKEDGLYVTQVDGITPAPRNLYLIDEPAYEE